jgi:hypothetical protein
MLKPIKVMDLIKLFIKENVGMEDIVMLASDEEGNGYGNMQPEIFKAELKDGRPAIILFPYAEAEYEEYFKSEE